MLQNQNRSDERYKLAIEKNLDELQRALLIYTTIKGIEESGKIEFLFLKLVYNSLLNDYITKCIKVFENGLKVSSFWYIHRCNEKRLTEIARLNNIEISKFSDVASKLKKLRNKVHFHLDKKGVMDINKVWQTADLTMNELHLCVSSAQVILYNLAFELNLKTNTMPKEYNTIIPYRIANVINSGNW